MRLFYINAFVTPVFTVAFRPESRSHSYSYAPSIHDEIRRVKTGFGFNICYETPSNNSQLCVQSNPALCRKRDSVSEPTSLCGHNRSACIAIQSPRQK